MNSEKKLISIVLPAYNEQDNISYIYGQISQVLDKINFLGLKYIYDYEVIFVNDGSKDDTWLNIVKMSVLKNNIKGINFSRNFGKEIAMTAGLEYSSGDMVITLDCDGQHPVEKLPEFIKCWEDGYDIVYNKRPKTKGVSFVKTYSSKLFYYFFNKITDFELEPSTTDYRLLDRKVVDVFLKLEEKNRIYRGLIDWLGYNKISLEFDAKERMNGQGSTYSYFKLFKLALDSITSFSLFPLKVVGYLGVFITFISFFLICIMFLDRVFSFGFNFTNLAIVAVFNTLLIGIVLMSLGLIALYIANIHDEVRKRPLYIVKEKVNIG